MAQGPKYEIVGELGRGSYGVVYEAVVETGVRVAVKKVVSDSPESSELALQEFWALSSVKKRHRNVIWLDECILQRDRSTQELSAAVAFLHINGIVHRDLKPDNVLVASSPTGPVLKVADFGLSKTCQAKGGVSHSQVSVACGSDFYMAPELWKGQYSNKVDIFALGIIFWAMLERISFREAKSKKELLGAYFSCGCDLVPVGMALMENPSLELPIPTNSKRALNKNIQKLLRDMLAFNPRERPDAFSLQAKIDQVVFAGVGLRI